MLRRTLGTGQTQLRSQLEWKRCVPSKANEHACDSTMLLGAFQDRDRDSRSSREYHVLAYFSMASFSMHATSIPASLDCAKTLAAHTSSLIFCGADVSVQVPSGFAWQCQDSCCSHQLSGVLRCRRGSAGAKWSCLAVPPVFCGADGGNAGARWSCLAVPGVLLLTPKSCSSAVHVQAHSDRLIGKPLSGQWVFWRGSARRGSSSSHLCRQQVRHCHNNLLLEVRRCSKKQCRLGGCILSRRPSFSHVPTSQQVVGEEKPADSGVSASPEDAS